MKTYEEMLEEFKKKIEECYEQKTMSKALSGKQETLDERVCWDTPQTIEVSFRLNENLHYSIEKFVSRPCITLIEKEYEIIIKELIKHVEHTINVKEQGKLSKEDIEAARDWIGKKVAYRDLVVMHYEEQAKFQKNSQLCDPIRVPLRMLPQQKRGFYYAGLIDDAHVYWQGFIKKLALVFNNEKIIFKSTPLEVTLNPQNTQLIITKKCLYEPKHYSHAIVKIQL